MFCSKGIMGGGKIASGRACCHADCGVCGGNDCSSVTVEASDEWTIVVPTTPGNPKYESVVPAQTMEYQCCTGSVSKSPCIEPTDVECTLKGSYYYFSSNSGRRLIGEEIVEEAAEEVGMVEDVDMEA